MNPVREKQTKLHSTLVEPRTIRMERLLPGPVERVWAYLTESDKRAKWLAGGAFDLRVGGRIRLEFDNCSLPNDAEGLEKYKGRGKGQFEGVITRLEPLRLLAYTWKWDSGDSEVSYELSPRGKDVLLVIVHRDLSEKIVRGIMGGWDVHSGILADILNGVAPRPFWSTHDRLEKEYAG